MRPLPVEPRTERAAIGSRLRAVRQARSLTIEQLADLVQLTKSHLSRIERDLVSPSVSTLVTICDVLSIEVGELFRASDVKVVRRDEAPQINLGGEGVHEVLLSPRLEPRIQVLRSRVDPGVIASGGNDLYTVSAQLDVLHVISGRIAVRFADAEHELDAGDTLTLDGREPHSWRSLDDNGAELLWVLLPPA
ncbi:helix-turn-helix domain-containing protein [Microbacterium sp.]|uniref:helix-turn-helix domain-containing protein n=1 Tax=Microbacterium sp. TaxID=51671 RepID=UPI003C729A4F